MEIIGIIFLGLFTVYLAVNIISLLDNKTKIKNELDGFNIVYREINVFRKTVNENFAEFRRINDGYAKFIKEHLRVLEEKLREKD